MNEFDDVVDTESQADKDERFIKREILKQCKHDLRFADDNQWDQETIDAVKETIAKLEYENNKSGCHWW